MRDLITYLTQRPEGLGFVLPGGLEKALEELFSKPAELLPKPYRVFFPDETLPPILGFPVRSSAALAELASRLDRWIAEELACQMNRQPDRERAQQALAAYSSTMLRLCENALLSNTLVDYHGILWLAHSQELSKQFSSVPRRLGAIDTQLARSNGDAIKYRMFGRWASEIRDMLGRLGMRFSAQGDGEQERAATFVRLLLDNILILTEEFIGPDLREIRSFITGYLHRDSQSVRDAVERIRVHSSQLAASDPTFRGVLSLFGVEASAGIPVALVLDRRFQRFVFSQPSGQALLARDEREQLATLSRRLAEFSILYQLRRGVVWMNIQPDGQITSADRRGIVYSRSTRPIDFGRPGVVDPMVWRFGLMYDLASFSEILGALARSGPKEEIASYRQMAQFQRGIEAIAERHRLQFEKFLGDGAFYTTRLALRLVRAAVEIQRLYAEMKASGFAFDRGLRIALNFGYYRLLPMKTAASPTDRVMEFYGPGIVELSRLTTGKASREIEELQNFLIVHGYDPDHVQKFFAPLAQGADTVDHRMHARDFYAYVNANGHLVNEGIVASSALLQELSNELAQEHAPLSRIQALWGSYIGFQSGIPVAPVIGVRLIGNVSLKGLGKVEVAEIAPFAGGDLPGEPVEAGVSFLHALRADYAETTTGSGADIEEIDVPFEEIP